MSSTSYRQLTLNGLWKNNPALVQLLGLCPLLAVTASTVNALGLAAATLFVLVVSNTSVSLIRAVVSDTIRLPVFVMIIAAAVTVTELLMQAYSYELYQILGIFLPLITTNCIILGRADAFARKNAVPAALYDGFIMGVGFGAVLVLLGAIRELLGTGALFADGRGMVVRELKGKEKRRVGVRSNLFVLDLPWVSLFLVKVVVYIPSYGAFQ